jgi:transcriptional regulator with XRE-family HTH domain
MSASDDNLGDRLRAARGYAKLDQGTLAKRIGIGREAVIALEADERELTIPQARRVADVCRVPLSFLLNGWAAPADLIERVERLETRATAADADREVLAQEIESLSGALETRIENGVSQALERARQRTRADDRPAGEAGRAP